jgi:hypothetical protein
MSLIVAAQTARVTDGIDVIRDRLGDSGTIRKNVTPVLQEAARIGATAARIHAPKGATGRLSDAIVDDAFTFRVREDYVNVRFGVTPVMPPGRGSSLYPIYVHEGTGLYGRLHRRITAKTGRRMFFPGGGKPWPTEFGRTGRVVKSSVRGQKAQPYMGLAYEEASVYVETHLDEMMSRLVD